LWLQRDHPGGLRCESGILIAPAAELWGGGSSKKPL
jgi:hypothetical protein